MDTGWKNLAPREQAGAVITVILFVVIPTIGALALLAMLFSGCTPRSPLSEMMTLTQQGHIACVRDGVLRRGKENCR